MNCVMCGMPIPDGRSKCCSMCMGDIGHGTDGYYEDWARRQNEREQGEQENDS